MDETTKGPWNVHCIFDYDGAKLFYVETPTKIVAEEVDNEADARLIAAAPDLLEALREARAAISLVDHSLMFNHAQTLARIDAAMKKAGS